MENTKILLIKLIGKLFIFSPQQNCIKDDSEDEEEKQPVEPKDDRIEVESNVTNQTSTSRREVKKITTHHVESHPPTGTALVAQEETKDGSDPSSKIYKREIVQEVLDNDEVDNESTISSVGTVVEGEPRVGLVYSEEMMKHKDYSNSHPEKPDRIKCIYDKLVEKKLLTHLNRIEFSEATEEQLLLVHKKEIIEKVLSSDKLMEGTNTQEFDQDNYECKYTGKCALLAAGGTIEGVRTVLDPSKNTPSAFCIVRPPGHHAFGCKPGGFCFFNNVAIAAKVAQKEFDVKRICIFDWDVHHGDGTQDTFYEDNSVLYISIHRYDNQEFYPEKDDGCPKNVGEDKGEGYNVNVAWNHKNSTVKSEIGDKEYKFVCNKLLSGIIKEFEPELIIVSAGFDAAKGDPIGKLNVTPKGYQYMISMLRSICPKILVVLEGGYNFEAISRSAEATVKSLLKKEHGFVEEDIDIDSLKPSVFMSILRTAEHHQYFWTSAKDFIQIKDKL